MAVTLSTVPELKKYLERLAKDRNKKGLASIARQLKDRAPKGPDGAKIRKFAEAAVAYKRAVILLEDGDTAGGNLCLRDARAQLARFDRRSKSSPKGKRGKKGARKAGSKKLGARKAKAGTRKKARKNPLTRAQKKAVGRAAVASERRKRPSPAQQRSAALKAGLERARARYEHRRATGRQNPEESAAYHATALAKRGYRTASRWVAEGTRGWRENPALEDEPRRPIQSLGAFADEVLEAAEHVPPAAQGALSRWNSLVFKAWQKMFDRSRVYTRDRFYRALAQAEQAGHLILGYVPVAPGRSAVANASSIRTPYGMFNVIQLDPT